jgi:hypothetical protein
MNDTLGNLKGLKTLFYGCRKQSKVNTEKLNSDEFSQLLSITNYVDFAGELSVFTIYSID